MMHQRSSTLRVRFAVWVATLLLITFVLFGGFVYVRLTQGLAASVDDSLRVSAAQASAAVDIKHDHPVTSDEMLGPGVLSTLSERGLTIRVFDVHGTVIQAVGLYRALPLDSASLVAGSNQQSTFLTERDPTSHESLRLYTVPLLSHDKVVGMVQVGQSLTSIENAQKQVLGALLLSIPLLVGGAAVGGYLLAARALAPIDTMTRTAQRISATDLHARLALPPTNDEVGRLADTFDGMLARLDESFQRERRFSADAAHELRTPLTAMHTILGVVRERQRTPADYARALDDLALQTDRLRGLVEALLHLARSDNVVATVYERIDLALLLGDVAETLLPLADSRGLTLTCRVPHTLAVWGDSDDLIRLFVNLIDNAIKYTPHGSIQVCADTTATTVCVRIVDTGVGIDAAHLPHLGERFYRVETARSTPGIGLGLALAHGIVHAHHGTLTIQSTVDVGTTVIVTLPQVHDDARGNEWHAQAK